MSDAQSEYNSADKKQVKEKKQEAKNSQEVAIEDLQWQMSDPRGRRLMWQLLERTHVFQTSFTGNSKTFFNEGERQIGLYYMADLNVHCPDEYSLMMKENTQNG